MRARLMIENPADIEGTIKLTMKMKDWEALRDQLDRAWPSSDLSRSITELLGQSRKVFYPTNDE